MSAAQDPYAKNSSLRFTRRGVIGMAGGLAAAAAIPGVSSIAAAAPTMAPPSLAEGIAARFAATRTIAAEFLQFGPDGSRASGRLFIDRPGKIRINYDEDTSLRVISDGHHVVTRALGEKVELRRLAETHLRFLVDSRIDIDGNDFTYDTTDGLVLRNAHIAMSFHADQFHLSGWTFADAKGRETTFVLRNICEGVSFDGAIFIA